MRMGRVSVPIEPSSTTTLITLSSEGRSNMVSSSVCSSMERKPRAPVLRSSALRDTARSAASRTSSSTPSIANIFWYCLSSEFFQRRHHRQAADEFRDQTVLDQVFRLHAAQHLGRVLAVIAAFDFRTETD